MRRVTMGPNEVAFFARASDTGGAYSLVEWLMAPPPAPGPPLHRHLAENEAVLMLEGRLDCTLDGQVRRLEPGDFVMVRMGRWHTLANPGPNHARFLIILSPPGYEGFQEEMAELSRAGAPDPDEVLAVQAKYHMDAGGQARRLEQARADSQSPGDSAFAQAYRPFHPAPRLTPPLTLRGRGVGCTFQSARMHPAPGKNQAQLMPSAFSRSGTT